MRNRLLTLTLSGLLTLGAAATAIAQDPPPPPDQAQAGPGGPGGQRRMDPDRQLQRMTRELSLSSDQQAQIKPILVARQQQMEAVFQDQAGGGDRRARMQSIRQDSNAKIEAVLNDQQKQKFAEMRQHMGRRGGPDGPPPPDGAAQPQL